MPLVHFELPMPPSVNSLYPTSWKTRMRFKSGTYKNWEKEAGLLFLAQMRSVLTNYSVTDKCLWKAYWQLTFKKSHFNKCDCCNYVKALHDLVSKTLFIDDRYLQYFSVEKKCGEKDHVIGELVLGDL